MNFKRQIYTVLTAALVVLSSCKDDFLDINENPNQTAVSTPQLVLTNALNVTAGRLAHNEIGSFWGGYWAPSGDVSGYVAEKTYDITPNFRTNIWTGIYDNLADYDYVEKKATELNLKSFIGIAKIMKAYNFQILVDTYGNVAYTEALQGTKVIRPKYDDAQAIYEDLIVKITEGIEDLKTADEDPGASDIVFQGDLSLWRKFANSLRLRILLRQAYVPGRETYIQTEISKITAEGSGFLDVDESAASNPGYLKTAGKQNQFWDTYGFSETDVQRNTFNFTRTSEYAVNTLRSLNDPRLDFIASKSPSDQAIRGVRFGEEGSVAYSNRTSGIGSGILKSFDQSMYLMTSAESLFLQAEAVQRGYLPGDAKTLFQNGVMESFKLLEVEIVEEVDGDEVTITAEEAAEDYYTSEIANADWESSPDKLTAIILQKWIAMDGFNGFEAWAEYRRSGIPNIPLSLRALGTQQPARLLYPIQEVATNNDNVIAQGDVNTFTSKIFWDKN